MQEKVIKNWLDIAPAYLNFLLAFLGNPRRAFAAVAGTAKVSADITSILLGGVAFSYLLIAAIASPALKTDPSNVAMLLRQWDYRWLPVIALLLSTAAGVVSHLLGKLYAYLGTLSKGKSNSRWDAKLGGTIEDSVNAALGFAAVYLPLVSTVLCGVSWLAQDMVVWAAAAGGFLALFAAIYFPWSLSATHPETGFVQAFLAFSGSIVLLALPFTL